MKKVTGSKEIIRQLPTGIIRWYPFQEGKRAYAIGGDAVWHKLLQDQGLIVDEEFNSEGAYDYLISIGSLEQEKEPVLRLKEWKKALADNGVLLLGLNNRLGIRFFCGDTDQYTQQVFDGVEDYATSISCREGRMYDKAQIKAMLIEAEFQYSKCYSVFPRIEAATLLLAEDERPMEDLAGRIFCEYHTPDTVFLQEERLYRSLEENDLLHAMANGFLFECRMDGTLSETVQVTISLERGEEYATATILGKETVIKKPAYSAGKAHICKMAEHHARLQKEGIQVVPLEYIDGDLCMPMITGETAQAYFHRLCRTDRERFVSELDRFCDCVRRSSEVYEGSYEGVSAHLMKYAYPDLIPINAFLCDGEFVFFDQEFCVEEYPLEVVLYRAIAYAYVWEPSIEQIFPVARLYERYGIQEHIQKWIELSWRFLDEVRNDTLLAEYHNGVRRNDDITRQNRIRMNCSERFYRNAICNMFVNTDTRKLILFGAGAYARRFLAMYGEDYPVYRVIDNDHALWGGYIYREGEDASIRQGVKIVPPKILEELRHGEYKVIVCMKHYRAVVKQLEKAGIFDYGVFDPAIAYKRKRHPIPSPTHNEKKYHIGYNAGVFDLYHIGHLNIFKRAKELCDYLIVGVVSDEGVRRFKGVEPFVPFEERVEMVRSCRYVDEVVEIPLIERGTEEAWQMHHFDVQFSGSDYANNPLWLQNKKFLEDHGATMEFFPYTESTSSSKLKALINERLL